MSANSVSTPRPTATTAPSNRDAAKARAHSPSRREPKPPQGETIVSKALDGLGLDGAASEARRGAQRIRQAASDQPTPERAIVATVVEGARAGIDVANAAAGDVADTVGRVVKPVAERALGPTIREGREAIREVGEAGREIVETGVESAGELVREVSDAWETQPTIERQLAVAGYEVAENLIQGGVRQAGSILNAGKEVLEGAAELAIHNPALNAARAGVEVAWNGVTELFGRGARGAVKAGSSLADTGRSIAERTVDQQRENLREIGDAAGDFGRGWLDSLNPFDHDEVSEAWNRDTTIERRVIGAGYEVVENGIQDGVRNVANAGRVVAEAGEAVVEDVVTGVRNVADGVAGGVEAVGGFVSGLFGG